MKLVTNGVVIPVWAGVITFLWLCFFCIINVLNMRPSGWPSQISQLPKLVQKPYVTILVVGRKIFG